MYLTLIIIHVIICLTLIATILLQAGRGGGLTEAFGGEGAQQLFGSQAPEMLKKATEIAAIAFLVTSLLLGMITARRGRSLIQETALPVGGVVDRGVPAAVPQATMPKEPVPFPAQETEAQDAEQAADLGGV